MCQLTNIPGKVLLSEPDSNTLGRESKIRAVTEGSDVPNSGSMYPTQVVICIGSQGNCTAVLPAVLQTPSLLPLPPPNSLPLNSTVSSVSLSSHENAYRIKWKNTLMALTFLLPHAHVISTRISHTSQNFSYLIALVLS